MTIVHKAGISFKHFNDKDLLSLVKQFPEFINAESNPNPYMADCVKLDKEDPELSFEVEICHKAWLEGVVSLFVYLKDNDKLKE